MVLNFDYFVLCVALIFATQSIADTREISTGTHHKYCGRNLVNVLTLVCDGMYNRPKDGSKNIILTDLDLSRFRSKRSVVSVFQRDRNRHRRGAYDECCRKGCSIDEMVGYCGP